MTKKPDKTTASKRIVCMKRAFKSNVFMKRLRVIFFSYVASRVLTLVGQMLLLFGATFMGVALGSTDASNTPWISALFVAVAGISLSYLGQGIRDDLDHKNNPKVANRRRRRPGSYSHRSRRNR